MPRGETEQAEQIISKLREVEVEVGRGKAVCESVKKIGSTEQTYCRLKKNFGGLRMDQAKRRQAIEHARRVCGHRRASERRSKKGDAASSVRHDTCLSPLAASF